MIHWNIELSKSWISFCKCFLSSSFFPCLGKSWYAGFSLDFGLSIKGRLETQKHYNNFLFPVNKIYIFYISPSKSFYSPFTDLIFFQVISDPFGCVGDRVPHQMLSIDCHGEAERVSNQQLMALFRLVAILLTKIIVCLINTVYCTFVFYVFNVCISSCHGNVCL